MSKRKANDDSESNSDSDDSNGGTSVYKSKKHKKKKRKLMEEKNDRIEGISSLREKHGDKFSMIQYRMWSGLIDNGKHSKYSNNVVKIQYMQDFQLWVGKFIGQ